MTPPVRVMYQAAVLRRRLTGTQRLLQSIDHEVCAHVTADPPAHNPAGIDVNHKGHKHLTLPCRYVSKVGNPKLVWALGIELAIDQVQRAWSGGIGLRRSDLLASAGSFKSKLSHQALHGTAGNWQTFPVHLFPDFDDPVDLPVGMPDTLDITAVLGIGLAALAAQPGEVSLSNPAPVT